MIKLISIIYFYLVSLIGLVLLIIGIFTSIHFIVGVSAYNKYPLPNGMENQCMYQVPQMAPDGKQPTANYKEQLALCQKNMEEQRMVTKKQDLEKALSFTFIGILLFGIHFYFARKLK